MLPRMESSQTGMSEFPWFVLRVRSNCERNASAHLRARGYEEFSPSYKVTMQWSDRKRVTERFLFPSYVFCRLNPEERLPVLTVPGAVNLLGFGAGPTPVPDHEIEQVRAMVQSGLPVTPSPYLIVGQRVCLVRGPLTGVEGILELVKGASRLVVSINMLQRSVSTEIERGWVQPLEDCISRGGLPVLESGITSAKVCLS